MQTLNVSNAEPTLLIEALILQYAGLYNIDPNVIRAIMDVESGGSSYCMKHEPKLIDRIGFHNPSMYVKPYNDLETEKVLQHSSIGAMQVLGVVARELGFNGLSLLELCKPEIGIKYGAMKLKKIMERPSHSGQEDKIIAAYNAGSGILNTKTGMFINQRYVDAVYQRLRKYRALK